jgi:hypothetical protein
LAGHDKNFGFQEKKLWLAKIKKSRLSDGLKSLLNKGENQKAILEWRPELGDRKWLGQRRNYFVQKLLGQPR